MRRLPFIKIQIFFFTYKNRICFTIRIFTTREQHRAFSTNEVRGPGVQSYSGYPNRWVCGCNGARRHESRWNGVVLMCLGGGYLWWPFSPCSKMLRCRSAEVEKQTGKVSTKDITFQGWSVSFSPLHTCRWTDQPKIIPSQFVLKCSKHGCHITESALGLLESNDHFPKNVVVVVVVIQLWF